MKTPINVHKQVEIEYEKHVVERGEQVSVQNLLDEFIKTLIGKKLFLYLNEKYTKYGESEDWAYVRKYLELAPPDIFDHEDHKDMNTTGIVKKINVGVTQATISDAAFRKGGINIKVFDDNAIGSVWFSLNDKIPFAKSDSSWPIVNTTPPKQLHLP
jgi:hypothetical protein